MVIELRSPGEIEAIGAAGAVVAEVLRSVGEHLAAGTALGELDEIARAVLGEAGARPVDGVVITTSVNDEIIGGHADARVLRDGDLISVAAQADVGGWMARAATSACVGAGRRVDELLVEATAQALADGVAAAGRAGARVGDLGRAIGLVGRSAGYGIPPIGGHGVGRGLRLDPVVANDGHPGRGLPLRPGLVFTLEPIFAAGGHDHLNVDHSAPRTDDGSNASHHAHTIAITDDGPRVLTVPAENGASNGRMPG